MRSRASWVLVPALLLAGCVDDPAGPDPADDPLAPAEVSPDSVVLDRLAPPAARLHLLSRDAHRTPLGDGLAHYRFEVPLGHGPHDVVRIHRVVRERRPHRPVRTRGAVFMTHGASLSFESIFLRAGTEMPDPRTSVAAYLADRDIDVWGMDFGWTLVPEATTDFEFMRDWGVERDVDHTLAAMSVARLIRGLSGQGFRPIHLLGFSYGGNVSYAAAGRESGQHWLFRDVAGIVPVDIAATFPDAKSAAPFGDFCAQAAGTLALIESGDYVNPGGITFGSLPPQTALFVAALTYLTNDREFWHFFSGMNTPTGVELLDTDPGRLLRFLQDLPPYMPRRGAYEAAAAPCPDIDVSWDDHLASIEVPILYLGAAGGFGSAGHYTVGLTASDDITTHTVSIPGRAPETDYGHADLFMADSAPDLAWSVLADWLIDHDSRGARPWRK